jgi:hypothetical protein
MPRLEENNKYQKITKRLRDLRKIDAPSNFEIELLIKINVGNQRKEKKLWFDKLFSPQLIPSTALAVTTVIILLLISPKTNEIEDPLRTDPPLRESTVVDLEAIRQASTEQQMSNTEKREKRIKSPSGIISDDIKEKEEITSEYENTNKLAASDQQSSIHKIEVMPSSYRPNQTAVLGGGLNYRMVRATEEERKQIEILRQQIDKTGEHFRKN